MATQNYNYVLPIFYLRTSLIGVTKQFLQICYITSCIFKPIDHVGLSIFRLTFIVTALMNKWR